MELKGPKGGAKERSQRGYRCEEGSYRGESRKTLARESFIVVVVMFVKKGRYATALGLFSSGE